MLKNVTLSADDSLIEQARQRAQRERTTLNEQFRLWLVRYARKDLPSDDYESLMRELSYARAGRSFSRDELN
ncbi:MAG: hypothetical protein ACREV0_08465, partial [Burkholderiales bacterium]